MAGEVQRPKWFKGKMTESQISSLSQLVEKIESQSSAEIVPMIVRSSSARGHIPLTLTLLFSLLFVTLEYSFFDLSSRFEMNLWLGLSTVLFYFLSLALSHNFWIQRVFIPNEDEEFQVWQRAELEFYRQKVHATGQRMGVLIFVSVMERKAVVLADEGIAKVLPAETWKVLVERLSGDFKKGDWEKAFRTALESCGELLIKNFPSSGEKPRNQLANSLVIKE